MLTVSNLAKQFRISRATILYYEKQGLLKPAHRSENGYRWYGTDEMQRLGNILSYRSFGLPVTEIRNLVDNNHDDLHAHCLRRQFHHLEHEIQKLRRQQKAIVNLLEHPDLLEKNMVTKDRWVEIMRASGLDDDDMKNWHKQFEKLEPEAHQQFLETLSISANEINHIREWSKN